MSHTTLSRQKLFEIMRLGPVWEARDQPEHESSESTSTERQLESKILLIIADKLQDRALMLFHDMLNCIGLTEGKNCQLMLLKDKPRDEFLVELRSKQPQLVWVLGDKAVESLLPNHSSVASLQGTSQFVNLEGFTCELLASDHPESALQMPLKKRQFWDDLLLLSQTLQ